MRGVAVSQRVDVWESRNERRDALDQRLAGWLAQAGFVPFPVPNSLSQGQLEEWLGGVKPGACLLSGGNEIGDPLERDRTEAQLLKYAQRQRLPLLGICRGMQFMAARAGVELRRLDGHIATRHAITMAPDAEGELPGEVNSFHGWGLKEPPSGYKVLARATHDGTVEAISHNSLPWEGWMWHPEREESFCDIQLGRLQGLFGK